MIENLNKIPFSSIESDSIDLKAVSYLDSLNEDICDKTFLYFNECNAICYRIMQYVTG